MSPSIEIPDRVHPRDDNGYLEQLTKAIFQAGFSWTVIRQKWPNFLAAFDQFDVDTVAAYDAPDLERLLADAAIVRNGRKIQATIDNARTIQTLRGQHGSFAGYLRAMDGWSYERRRTALTGQFRGLGRTSCFVFLWCVDEETPAWEDR